MRLEAQNHVSRRTVIDPRRNIQILDLERLEEESKPGTELPAHGDAVLGVRPLQAPNSFNASFFTWSASGQVILWDHDGKCVASLWIGLQHGLGDGGEVNNELRAVEASTGVDFVASGDRNGVLRSGSMEGLQLGNSHCV